MKKIAFILALLIMFSVTGCYDETAQTSSTKTSAESETSVVDNNSNVSVDPSTFFPNNMSVNEFTIRVRDVGPTKVSNPNAQNILLLYGYQAGASVKRYIPTSALDLRSIVNKGRTGKDAARESHVVLLNDLLLIAIAVYDMEENTAYVVEDSTRTSSYIRIDQYYTPTDAAISNDSQKYSQAVYISDDPDETQFIATYGFPVWHYITKKYDSIPEDYVLTLTEELYDGDEVVSEEVTFTLTYQDIQEALA